MENSKQVFRPRENERRVPLGNGTFAANAMRTAKVMPSKHSLQSVRSDQQQDRQVENIRIPRSENVPMGIRHPQPSTRTALQTSVDQQGKLHARRFPNPIDCLEYEKEVYLTLFQRETMFMASEDMFNIQSNITSRMRSTVVDWVVAVHRKFLMHTDTLYYIINYIDRYLSVRNLDKSKFQMLACAALLLSSKAEEKTSPSMTSLVEIAGCSFTEAMLQDMEADLWVALNYSVHPVVASQFIRRMTKTMEEPDVAYLAFFICETSLLDASFNRVLPSLVAASSVAIALAVIKGPNTWTLSMEELSGYSINAVRSTALALYDSLLSSSTSSFSAIRKKYASSHMYGVGRLDFPEKLIL